MKTAKGKQRGWDVVIDGEVIDTVFFDSDMSAKEIHRSLVNHDGYDPTIQVRPRKSATASVKTALHAKSTPAIEKAMDQIEELLGKIPNAAEDTYLWRKWRTLRNEYKLALIPQLQEYISKNFMISQDSKENPILRRLDTLELAIEDAGVKSEKLAPDKKRIENGNKVVAFLDRLARAEDAPLRQMVAALNSLDLRKEADTVDAFIKASKAITDTVNRVVLDK